MKENDANDTNIIEGTAVEVKTEKPSLDLNYRRHPRISLRESNQEDITLACDGITVMMLEKTWWQYRELGFANIKDIGMGGVGLITSIPLAVNQKIYLELDEMILPILIMRTQPINTRLTFFGARWVSKKTKNITKAVNKLTTKK